jgi:hypothetical protein
MDNYEGQMIGEDAHGVGRDVYPDTDEYKYSDFGYIYEGEFKKTKLNGWGRVIYRSGRIVEGLFKDDKLI